MEYVMGLVTNKVLLSAVAAWFVAQGSKIILDVMKETFTFKRLSGGGGMPSAHSATVIGLTTATAIVYGTGGFEFPMALFFAIIVMYDAVGVRLETGREAKALNRLRRRDLQEHKQPVMEQELEEKIRKLEEKCSEFESSYFDLQMENVQLKSQLEKYGSADE